MGHWTWYLGKEYCYYTSVSGNRMVLGQREKQVMKKRCEKLLGNQNARGNRPNNTSFKNGDIPWNKGVKGIHLSPNTEFKKGMKSNRIKHVGTMTIRRDKNGTLRHWIKIDEPSKWIEYSRYLWNKHHSGLKPNYILHHINNDSLDDRIDNLIMVSRQEHPTLHNKWNTKNYKVSKDDWHNIRNLGIEAIGIEQDEHSFEIARKRIGI